MRRYCTPHERKCDKISQESEAISITMYFLSVKVNLTIAQIILVLEGSRHFATPLVSPRNGVWKTSAEILRWWRVTTQIWVVLLIGCNTFLPVKSTAQIWAVTSHQYGFYAPQTSLLGELVRPSGGDTKSRLFSRAKIMFAVLLNIWFCVKGAIKLF